MVQPARTCAVQGCARPHEARGLCHGHYLRWRRTGDVEAARPLRPRRRAPCSVAGCDRPSVARALCRAHYRRLLDRGDLRANVAVRSPERQGWLSHGYRGVMVPEALRHLAGGETQIAEHRLVMAQLLDRPLAPDESVHHRNGDRLDNRPENLELWSRWQPRGQRVDDKVEWAVALLRRYAPQRLARRGANGGGGRRG